jgi:outer membrane protein TolC
MGISASSGRLMRPVTEPMMARVLYQWDDIVQEALARRVELRRQKWEVTRAELELLAAKNYLRPQLDAVARYRFRGLGHDLVEQDPGAPWFASAYRSLSTGDFQEWGLGVELTIPIGYRAAHAAVRNAELNLARTRVVYREQEEEILSDLSAAVGELDRAYVLLQTTYNLRRAARDLVANLQLERERSTDEAFAANILSQLLDAQRRSAEADIQFFRALSEHAFAIKQVHFEKGSLLDLNEIYLTEGPSPQPAYCDAAERASRTHPSSLMSRVAHFQPPISHGIHPQEVLPPETTPMEVVPAGDQSVY